MRQSWAARLGNERQRASINPLTTQEINTLMGKQLPDVGMAIILSAFKQEADARPKHEWGRASTRPHGDYPDSAAVTWQVQTKRGSSLHPHGAYGANSPGPLAPSPPLRDATAPRAPPPPPPPSRAPSLCPATSP